MALTPEQKLKMLEGRKAFYAKRRAEKEAAKLAPPIQAIPAGHAREEEIRRRTDQFVEQEETERHELGIEAIDQSRLRNIDNEIARNLPAHRPGMGPYVSNPVPGFRYCWVTVPDNHSAEAHTAIAGIRAMLEAAHYFPVTDNHSKETAKEFRGAYDGSSLRRTGDVVLFAIHEEDYQVMMLKAQMARQRTDLVEENFVNFGRQLMNGHTTAYDQNSQKMQRYYGQKAGAVERIPVVFSEQNLRDGNIPGHEIGRR